MGREGSGGEHGGKFGKGGRWRGWREADMVGFVPRTAMSGATGSCAIVQLLGEGSVNRKRG